MHVFFKLFTCLVIFHSLVVVSLLFSKLTFFPNNFYHSANGLDPDQDHSVGSDAGLNSLQRFSADDKSRLWQGKMQQASILDEKKCLK